MTKNVVRPGRHHSLRPVVPHVLTGVRVALGAAAVVATLDGRFHLAATLITMGAVTDGFDGFLARRLDVASSFGAMFDTFTDYLCFIVAPWILARALVASDGSIIREALIGLPLLTGAWRSARNSLLIVARDREVRELPGLATVFFAFLPVAVVFLDSGAVVGRGLPTVLIFSAVVLSLLMVTPVPYPKLTKFRGASAPILVLLAVMPFFGTRILAGVMIVVGLLYVSSAHLFVRRRPFISAGDPNGPRLTRE